MRIAGFVHEEEAVDVQFVKNVAELGQWVRIVTATHELESDGEPFGSPRRGGAHGSSSAGTGVPSFE